MRNDLCRECRFLRWAAGADASICSLGVEIDWDDEACDYREMTRT